MYIQTPTNNYIFSILEELYSSQSQIEDTHTSVHDVLCLFFFFNAEYIIIIIKIKIMPHYYGETFAEIR